MVCIFDKVGKEKHSQPRSHSTVLLRIILTHYIPSSVTIYIQITKQYDYDISVVGMTPKQHQYGWRLLLDADIMGPVI
jgi:hypothetical protein